MARVRAHDVFTPGSFPTYTYVERADVHLAEQLKRGIDTTGTIVSIAGPSKSGKTVLVERVVGEEQLIPISGGLISDSGDVWSRALDWMGTGTQTTTTKGTAHKGTLTANVKGGASLLGLAKAEAGASGALESGGSDSTAVTTDHGGMGRVIKEIGGSDFVLLLDDFHYIPGPVQQAVAQQIKEAARHGVKIVVAAVPHRSDDVIRANPDLRGRVLSVDIPYWTKADLEEIARLGFEALDVKIDEDSVSAFASEAAGSPQLMQSICLNACWFLGVEDNAAPREFTLDRHMRARVFERTAQATDYRSLVNQLRAGPKTRGTDRNTFPFKSGGEGDVYVCILRAIADDPPQLSFTYDDINRRVDDLCLDGRRPVGSSISGSLGLMARIVRQSSGAGAPVLDWNESAGVLDIPDPYLVFYLRWSKHFAE